MNLVTVYGLCSSADGRIRYVGQTNQKLSYRLNTHIAHALAARSKAHCAAWIRQVISAGSDIRIFAIEENAVRNEAERRLIKWYRKHGAALTNIGLGGDGNDGPRSEEHKRAISEALRGKPKSADHRRKLADALKGRPLPAALVEACRLGLNHKKGVKRQPMSEETKRRISVANKGRRKPLGHGAKISLSKIGRPRSQETKDKLSAYWAGRKRPRTEVTKQKYAATWAKKRALKDAQL